MPKQPVKKRCSTPFRSTYWFARNRTSAWAIVSRTVPNYLTSGSSYLQLIMRCQPCRGTAMAAFVVLPARTRCSVHLLASAFSILSTYSRLLPTSTTGPSPSPGSVSTTVSCSNTYHPEYPSPSSTSSSRPTSTSPSPKGRNAPRFAASLKSSSL